MHGGVAAGMIALEGERIELGAIANYEAGWFSGRTSVSALVEVDRVGNASDVGEEIQVEHGNGVVPGGGLFGSVPFMQFGLCG